MFSDRLAVELKLLLGASLVAQTVETDGTVMVSAVVVLENGATGPGQGRVSELERTVRST